MSKMTIEAIEENMGNDTLELTVRGTPDTVMRILVNGLPGESLREVAEALQREIDKRE